MLIATCPSETLKCDSALLVLSILAQAVSQIEVAANRASGIQNKLQTKQTSTYRKEWGGQGWGWGCYEQARSRSRRGWRSRPLCWWWWFINCMCMKIGCVRDERGKSGNCFLAHLLCAEVTRKALVGARQPHHPRCRKVEALPVGLPDTWG